MPGAAFRRRPAARIAGAIASSRYRATPGATNGPYYSMPSSPRRSTTAVARRSPELSLPRCSMLARQTVFTDAVSEISASTENERTTPVRTSDFTEPPSRMRSCVALNRYFASLTLRLGSRSSGRTITVSTFTPRAESCCDNICPTRAPSTPNFSKFTATKSLSSFLLYVASLFELTRTSAVTQADSNPNAEIATKIVFNTTSPP